MLIAKIQRKNGVDNVFFTDDGYRYQLYFSDDHSRLGGGILF